MEIGLLHPFRPMVRMHCIMSVNPVVNWETIEYLCDLYEVLGELVHMAKKRIGCDCNRPPAMEILTRNYNLGR